MDRRELASVAAESFGAGLAIVDETGAITWTNASWRESPVNGAGDPPSHLGSLEDVSAGAPGQLRVAIEQGIRAVIAGHSVRFELEYRVSQPEPTRFVISAAPLRGTSKGAVVVRTVLRAHAGHGDPPTAASSPAATEAPFGHLTPREAEILTLMARGLSNRDIASALGIEYTTVRGYVQSLIAKFGASSRLECVAKAYQWGMVR